MGLLSKITAFVTAMTVMAGSGTSQADKIFDKYILDSTSGSASGNSSEALSAPVDPVELSKGITIGWNLGNSLDATGSGMNSETSWGNPKVTKSLILKVKEAGFNAVRIPTTWFNHSDSELNVDSAWFDRVQEVVDYAYDEGMYVILNAHHEDWYDPYESNLTNARRKMKNLWTQIANRFKDYGERLIFEGLNEPRWRSTNWEWNGGNTEGRSAVNKLNECFVKAVRATGGNNSYRALMIPTYAASASGLDGFTLPSDKSLIVSVHAYSPYNFAMNENGTTKFDPDDVNSTGELTWLADTLYDRFVSKGTGVIIGECGTVNKNNLSDRMNWAGYFPKVFGEKGIRIFLWDNNAYGYGNEKFGLLHRDTLAWEFPDYIKKLVRTAKNYNK